METTKSAAVRSRLAPPTACDDPGLLLVGPYDPTCGEYTFLAPPLGVWRLAGVLEGAGIRARVFDPNMCDGSPEDALESVLRQERWDVVGFSTTAMTLRFDLALAHLARRRAPDAVLVAGGMEATFNAEEMFRIGPFDLVVLGEGERPLLELVRRLSCGANLSGIVGTAFPSAEGRIERLPQMALNRTELRDAIFQTPYEKMPYELYWERLEGSYRVGRLPLKADREARLAELRSVRLITLNYCPMNCTFCSSTNFLNAAQGSVAKIARLEADECLTMLKRIVAAHPAVRTVIFQDDIFVFPGDNRILPLCELIVEAKSNGGLPENLQFISTNRIDAMNPARLAAMRRAGFRVLGFGVESFSSNVLKEFNKAQIHALIPGVLETALALGITPFLDLILTSPRCGLEELAETIGHAYRWTLAGCEIGMYPYVIPFSGAALASNAELRAHTIMTRHRIAGTGISWEQATKILPIDPAVRAAILQIEAAFERRLAMLNKFAPHLPSRVRSLLWIACAAPVLAEAGQPAPDLEEAVERLIARLPRLSAPDAIELRREFGGRTWQTPERAMA